MAAKQPKKTAPKAKGGVEIILAVLVAATVILVTAGGVAATFMFGDPAVESRLPDELRRANAAHAILQQQRFGRLDLVARTLDGEEALAALLTVEKDGAEIDTESIVARLEEARERLGVDALVVYDPQGLELAQTAEFGPASQGAEAKDPWVVAALRDGVVSGVRRFGDGLAYAHFSRMVRNFENIGVLGVLVDLAPVADELRRSTGNEILVLTNSPNGPAVVASTHASPDAVVAALRVQGQALGSAMERGRTEENVDLTIDDTAWRAFVTPVRSGIGETPVGALAALAPVGDRLAAFNKVRWVLLGLGAVALAVGAALAGGLVRGALAPLGPLTKTVDAFARGEAAEIPPTGGRFTPLADALDRLLGGFRAQRGLQTYLARVARSQAEPSKGETGGAPSTREAALVGVRMRRFEDPKVSFDPSENMARYSRDLQRIGSMAAASNGGVEALLGHHLLLVFEGEGAVVRGLRAATEIQIALSQRENAFDDAVPPAVVLGAGSVASSTMVWEGRLAQALVGEPVTQINAALIEARADAVTYTQGAADVLVPMLERAGLQVESRPSVFGQGTLYQMSPMLAAQLTDAQPQTPKPRGAETSRSLAEVTPGTVLGNRFEILAELGVGRLGLTLKARDRERSDLVTMKVFRPEITADEGRRERLGELIRKATLLDHPNLPDILGSGVAEGLLFLTTELVRGMTLRWILEHDQVMPPAAVLLLMRQAASAVGASHRRNLLHGHLTPENLLVEAAGQVWVLDLGLSAVVGSTGEAVEPGAPYLAPEILDGGHPSPQGDVYACGVLLYEMLTGAVPYPGSRRDEVRERLMLGEAPSPSSRAQMPAALEQLVLACLARDPAARPASGDALADALAAV